MFCETNFYNLKKYQCFFASPLSYENNFFFYANLPGLIYTSVLIEGFFGAPTLIGVYLANCAISAATTTLVHRQIGFHKVLQRGRISNSNGNMTLLLASLFTCAAPAYMISQGRSQLRSIPFFYMTIFYFLLFFTNHVMDMSDVKLQKQAQNHNETHYAAMLLGASLGVLIRLRKRK